MTKESSMHNQSALNVFKKVGVINTYIALTSKVDRHAISGNSSRERCYDVGAESKDHWHSTTYSYLSRTNDTPALIQVRATTCNNAQENYLAEVLMTKIAL